MTTRRTTSYLLDVKVPKGDPNLICDALIKAYPGDVEASGVGPQRAFIRYRASSDGDARRVAGEIWGRDEWTLSRGYGIHKEVVDEHHDD